MNASRQDVEAAIEALRGALDGAGGVPGPIAEAIAKARAEGSRSCDQTGGATVTVAFHNAAMVRVALQRDEAIQRADELALDAPPPCSPDAVREAIRLLTGERPEWRGWRGWTNPEAPTYGSINLDRQLKDVVMALAMWLDDRAPGPQIESEASDDDA